MQRMETILKSFGNMKVNPTLSRSKAPAKNDSKRTDYAAAKTASYLSQSQVNNLGISHCAGKYALAISDPWNKMAQGACVPRHPSRPSQKISIFNRFQLTLGGTAKFGTIGAVVVMPSLANDAPTVYYADNVAQIQSLPTTAAQLQALIPFMKPVTPNSPYSSAQFTEPVGSGSGAQVQGRIVSSGVSIQYMGSELYKGGTYTMFVSPNHDNMLGYPATSLSSYDEALIERITNDRQWLVTSGIDEAELVYNLSNTLNSSGTAYTTQLVYPYSNGQVLGSVNNNLSNWTGSTSDTASGATTVVVTGVSGTVPATGTFSVLIPDSGKTPTVTVVTYSAVSRAGDTCTFTTTALTAALAVSLTVSGGVSYSSTTAGCVPGGAPMIIYIAPANSSLNNANVFEVEYVQHVEFVGPLTSALHTPTHSDSRGFEIVSTAAQRIPAARVEAPNKPLSRIMYDEVRQVIAETAPVAMNALRSAASSGLRYAVTSAANSMISGAGRLAIMG